MRLEELRKRLIEQIVGFNLGLILLLIFLYITTGFDYEEFSSTITLLAPLVAIYMGVLYHFMSKQLKPKNDDTDADSTERVIPYNFLFRWIVPLHLLFIYLILILKAIPLITFGMMNNLLAVVESIFGIGIGIILSALFDVEAK